MKKMILLVFSFFAVVVVAQAQVPSTTTAIPHSKGGRMEQVYKNGRKIVRFFNKDGHLTKELKSETIETKADIAKGKSFDPSSFKISLSSTMVAGIELARKKYPGRDMFVVKTNILEVRASANEKFIIVDEYYTADIDFADASDSEVLPAPGEADRESRVYDSEGNELVKITDTDGGVLQVSNTGKHIVLNGPESGGIRVLNLSKAVLADLPLSDPNIYFSDSDKYIIFAELTPEHDWSVSVFNTHNLAFERGKLVVPNATLQGIESFNISEKQRKITIVHSRTHSLTEEPKVDKLVF